MRVCFFFFFRLLHLFFSVLEENGDGHPTTESEIALQGHGQTAMKLQRAAAGKAAEQRRMARPQPSSKSTSNWYCRANSAIERQEGSPFPRATVVLVDACRKAVEKL